MGFNIVSESELSVIFISKILEHDYFLGRINIQYPIVQWILIDPEPHKPDQFNDDLAWYLLE